MILLVVEALLFGLFTLCMLGEYPLLCPAGAVAVVVFLLRTWLCVWTIRCPHPQSYRKQNTNTVAIAFFPFFIDCCDGWRASLVL